MTNEAQQYYPEDQSPFRAERPVLSERFAAAREAILLDYDFHTAVAYWGDLDDLRWWCLSEDVDILAPGAGDIERYLDQLAQQRYSPNTIARRLTTFRIFYDYLVGEGELASSPVAGMHRLRPVRSRKRRRLRQSQRERLWAAATKSGLRDEVIVRLVVNGVSIAQLCRARTGNVAPGGNGHAAITVEHRGVPRRVELDSDSAEALTRYVRSRPDGALFTNHAGNELTRSDVARVLRRLGQAARLPEKWW